MLTLDERYVQTVIREPNGPQFNALPLIFPPTHCYLVITEFAELSSESCSFTFFNGRFIVIFTTPPPLGLYHK